MPVSSTDISQLVAHQQAVARHREAQGLAAPPPPVYNPFNYDQSQQLNDAYRLSSMATAGALRSPEMALTGLSTVGMLGSLGVMGRMSPALSMLDPFKYVFGAGRAGWAAAGGSAHLGSALMGGLAMGGLAAGGLYAGYQAFDAYAGSAWRGGQDAMQFSGIADNIFRFSSPGTYSGRGFGVGDKQAMHKVIRDIAEIPEMLTSVGELQSIFAKMSETDLFTGVRNAEEVIKRFKGSVDVLKKMSQMLGTTMEGAMSAFAMNRATGFLSQQEMMAGGTSMAVTSAVTGMDVSQIANFRMYGGELAHSIGGSRTMGALGADRMLRNVQAQLTAGTLTERQIYEVTGLTGERGVQAMSQKMLQAGTRFSYSSLGTLLGAGLAGMEGGQFTGGLNRDLLGAIESGEYGIQDLKRMGRANVREDIFGYLDSRPDIQTDLAMEGPGVIAGLLRAEIEKRKDFSPQQLDTVIRRLLSQWGIQDRNERKVIIGLVKNYSKNKEQEYREVENAVRTAEMGRIQQERGLGGRWEMFKREMAQDLGITAVERWGSDVAWGVERWSENFMEGITGVRRMSLSERGAAAGAAALGGDFSKFDELIGKADDLSSYGVDRGATRDYLTMHGIYSAGDTGGIGWSAKGPGMGMAPEAGRNFSDRAREHREYLAKLFESGTSGVSEEDSRKVGESLAKHANKSKHEKLRAVLSDSSLSGMSKDVIYKALVKEGDFSVSDLVGYNDLDISEIRQRRDKGLSTLFKITGLAHSDLTRLFGKGDMGKLIKDAPTNAELRDAISKLTRGKSLSSNQVKLLESYGFTPSDITKEIASGIFKTLNLDDWSLFSKDRGDLLEAVENVQKGQGAEDIVALGSGLRSSAGAFSDLRDIEGFGTFVRSLEGIGSDDVNVGSLRDAMSTAGEGLKDYLADVRGMSHRDRTKFLGDLRKRGASGKRLAMLTQTQVGVTERLSKIMGSGDVTAHDKEYFESQGIDIEEARRSGKTAEQISAENLAKKLVTPGDKSTTATMQDFNEAMQKATNAMKEMVIEWDSRKGAIKESGSKPPDSIGTTAQKVGKWLTTSMFQR